jgi:hypothetical protein
MRPVLEYRLVMKSAGSETETVTTFDREQVFELREAIESAFHMQQGQLEMQHPPIEANGAARAEPGMGDEQRSEDGLHITRDWVVANVDLAPR